ncbi:MAG: 30S ribosomal protein S20, partial [Gemmatimonadota bacterium]|nr:30S ribosomal protein S20 [Gemmatimonadota bacterium]
MPRIKSAKKRMRQTKTRTARNKAQRSQLRNAVKKVRTAATGAEALLSFATAEQLL